MMIRKTKIASYISSKGIIFNSCSILFLLQLILQISSNYGNLVEGSQSHELYTDRDDVILLNETNFASHVFRPNNDVAYMVEFYNTYCGHCQAFAPVYKDLGSRVKNWTSVIRLAVLDCARDENVNICADNKVMGYPTIYFFPPRSRKEDPIDTLVDFRSLHYDWTVDGMEESMIDYLYNLTSSHRPYPRSLNALIPIQITDLKDLTSIYNSTVQTHDDVINEPHNRDFMIMIESHDSYMGRKLIVDYTRIGDRLELRRVLLNNTILIQKLLHESEYNNINGIQPLLLKLDGDIRKPFKIEILVRGELSSTLPSVELFERLDYVYARFKSFFEHFYSVELRHGDAIIKSDGATLRKPALDNKINDVDTVEQNHVANPPLHLVAKGLIDKKKVFALDLLKSISYMINHEILIKGDLTPAQYGVVRNMIAILNKYLPLDKWNSEMLKFIDDLRTRLDEKREIYEKDGIKRQELRDIVTLAGGDSVREHFKKLDWATCHVSQLKDKGFTCSLWVLFHTLSVGELFKAPPVNSRPKLVLTIMRDYITTFFGCTVCSTNFARETKDMEESLTDRNSSVLWLWKTHNLVNERLNNEKTNEIEKKKLAQVIYPQYELCPKCYKQQPSENVKRFLDVQWSLEDVLKFMIDIYRPSTVMTDVEVDKIYSKWMRKKIINAQMDGIYVENMSNNFHNNGNIIKLPLMGFDIDEQASSDDPKQQSIFSTGDISIWIILYFTSILIVVIVCISLNPRWKRYKTM